LNDYKSTIKSHEEDYLTRLFLVPRIRSVNERNIALNVLHNFASLSSNAATTQVSDTNMPSLEEGVCMLCKLFTGRADYQDINLQMDQLASSAKPIVESVPVSATGNNIAQVMAVRHYLFNQGPLHPINPDDYYDLRNSFIDSVLSGERGGIPVVLAIIFQSIAKRLGFHIDLISHPGHFLTRYQSTYIDVYHGVTYTLAELVERLQQQMLPVLPAFVNPSNDYLVLQRVE